MLNLGTAPHPPRPYSHKTMGFRRVPLMGHSKSPWSYGVSHRWDAAKGLVPDKNAASCDAACWMNLRNEKSTKLKMKREK